MYPAASSSHYLVRISRCQWITLPTWLGLDIYPAASGSHPESVLYANITHPTTNDRILRSMLTGTVSKTTLQCKKTGQCQTMTGRYKARFLINLNS